MAEVLLEECVEPLIQPLRAAGFALTALSPGIKAVPGVTELLVRMPVDRGGTGGECLIQHGWRNDHATVAEIGPPLIDGFLFGHQLSPLLPCADAVLDTDRLHVHSGEAVPFRNGDIEEPVTIPLKLLTEQLKLTVLPLPFCLGEFIPKLAQMLTPAPVLLLVEGALDSVTLGHDQLRAQLRKALRGALRVNLRDATGISLASVLEGLLAGIGEGLLKV